MKLTDLNPNETIRKLNPQLFGPPLGAVVRAIGQRRTQAALESTSAKQQRRRCRVVLCVHLLSLRRRIIDDDNLVAGHKGLRDAIARSLGLDDGDPRIRWEYSQGETRGEQGTIVRIERLK